jgi:hypothetical protein
MSIELRISLFPLSFNVLFVYAPCECGCIHEDTLFLSHPLSRLVELNSSADGWSNCGCLAVIPRHKGRTKLISILLFWQFWVALLINRYVVTEYVHF